MKYIHDVGPSAFIRSSEGPENDVQKFYSTTYSVTHKYYGNNVRSRPVEYSHFKLPRTFVKRTTGYTSNLKSYVAYDRAVDEKDFKIGMDSYVSSTAAAFKARPPPTNIQKSTERVITAKHDSGFTYLPDSRKEVQISSGDQKSIMSASYSPSIWKLKSSSHDKRSILSSSSAFITFPGEIRSLGDSKTLLESKTILAEKRKARNKLLQPQDDGFTRSGPRKIWSDGFNRERFIGNNNSLAIDKIKKLDFPNLINMLDPNNTQSTSHIVHHNLSLIKDTLEIQKSGIIIGNKEDSGSVKDTSMKLPVLESHPEDRFSSETSRKFSYPAFKFDMKTLDCRTIRNSAFVRNFAYRYTQPSKTDEATYASLHPSVAKGSWIEENGLYTEKPTRTPYTLVIE